MMNSYFDGIPPEIKKMSLEEIEAEIEEEMKKIKSEEKVSTNSLDAQ